MLTLKKLKEMKQGMFALGEVIDDPTGANMANTGKMIKWVAVRGGYHDWCIYCDNPYSPCSSYTEVASVGDKITNREYITRLVPCDKEALEMYRD